MTYKRIFKKKKKKTICLHGTGKSSITWFLSIPKPGRSYQRETPAGQRLPRIVPRQGLYSSASIDS